MSDVPAFIAAQQARLDRRVTYVGTDAAGQIHEDGEGFIDFVVVAPTARRTGLGFRLEESVVGYRFWT